jgi:CubicO group peptidase (beta-lactamase class C family)
MQTLARRAGRALALLALLQAFPGAARAEPLDEQAVDALVQEALKSWRVPGLAVAVVRDGRAVYLKGFGVRELGTEQPVTPDTLFAIGSTTKAFTTTAMAMLVDDGKMAWDDSVRKHLAYFQLQDPLADRGVTLRDLAAHRTGLGRHDLLWYGAPCGREELIRRLAHLKPDHPFRSAYEYQNITYLAAGQAVGAAARSTWEDVVQQRILTPLGMKGANFTTAAAQKAPDHASPHHARKGKLAVVPWYNADNIAPAGAINAGVGDLGKWVSFQLGDGTWGGKRLLSAKNLAETHSPQTVMPVPEAKRLLFPDTTQMSYALGWVVQDYRGHGLVWHDGSIDGFQSQITLVPAARLGVVILANRDGSETLRFALTNSILDLALGLPKKPWLSAFAFIEGIDSLAGPLVLQKADIRKRHKGTKPSRELAGYTGVYEEPAYGRAEVVLDEGVLVLKWNRFKPRLEHFHFDTFTTQGEEVLDGVAVVFTLGADGEVEQMKVPGVADFKKVGRK